MTIGEQIAAHAATEPPAEIARRIDEAVQGAQRAAAGVMAAATVAHGTPVGNYRAYELLIPDESIELASGKGNLETGRCEQPPGLLLRYTGADVGGS